MSESTLSILFGTAMKLILSPLVILAVFSFITPGNSQPVKSPTPAVELSREWTRLRAEAESIAVRQHMPIRGVRSDGTDFELQRFDNGMPVYYKTDNSYEAGTLSSNKVYPGGGFGFNLTGEGITLGEWDAGAVRTTHRELAGRVGSHDGSLNYHSTHVAGTMVATGIIGLAKGMSYKGQLTSYDWNNDAAEMSAEAAAGLRVSNHSYGTITGWYYNYFGDGLWAWFGSPSISTTQDYKFGFYDLGSQSFDNVARANPYYLPCVAAGNDRGEGPGTLVTHWVYVAGSWIKQTVARNADGNSTGYDCISGTALGKNVLTVGAIYRIPTGYGGPSSVIMTAFSGWGPADDGRIKPDVVGSGYSVYSTLETNDSAYGSLSGTSMATPNVSGSIGLLLQLQQQMHGATPLLASTMKGLIINTADEAGANPGPDYVFGWGLMNTLHAAQLMKLDSVEGAGSHLREIVLHQGDTITVDMASRGAGPLQTTICWTDVPGTPVAASLNPRNKMLVNDLDLRVIRKRDGTLYKPWVLDVNNPSNAATTGDNITDNVEQVQVASPDRSLYTIRITHKGTLNGGQQTFSLIMNGNVATIGPALVAYADSIGHRAPAQSVITDSLKFRNWGDSVLTLHPSVPDSAKMWISFVEDSVAVAPLDSVTLHVTLDGTLLKQWTTYRAGVPLENNDTANAAFSVPFVFELQGPRIAHRPGFFNIDVATGESKTESLVIRNTGTNSLTVALSDTGASLPPWLELSGTGGTIPAGDSLTVLFTFNQADIFDGDYYTVVRLTSNDSLTGTVLVPAEIHIGTRRMIPMTVSNGWNMVSVPVIPINDSVSSLFPVRKSRAFLYSGAGYAARDTMVFTTGYWIKFDSVRTTTIDGHMVFNDSVEVAAGWNLIGALTKPAGAGSVLWSPADMVTSPFFGYNQRYFITDSLYPGRAYWVQASKPGKFFVTSAPAASPMVASVRMPESFCSLTITDAAFRSQELRFGPSVPGMQETGMYALPPIPPAGAFDVRFASGRSVELVSTTGATVMPLLVQGFTPPITISWRVPPGDSRQYELSAGNAGAISLSGTGSRRIDPGGIATLTMSLKAGGAAIPKQFALHQNYPNPFNPSTHVSFEIRESRFVLLKIYDVLGKEVAVLVDEKKEPGRYSVEWNAANYPGGVYFCRMQAGAFVQTRELLLVK